MAASPPVFQQCGCRNYDPMRRCLESGPLMRVQGTIAFLIVRICLYHEKRLWRQKQHWSFVKVEE